MKSFTKTIIAIVLLTVAFSTCKKDSTIDVTGVALNGSASITMKVGDEVSLVATVEPRNATNNKLSWKSSDATVVSVADGKLKALKEGTADVTATAGKKSATVTITVAPAGAAFVAVTDITDVPASATAGTPLTLTGTVAPANATNKTIVWTVKDAGTTGATISGNTFNATAAGTATVTATIEGGATATTPFTKEFEITVNAGFVAVTGITDVPETATAGTPLTLTGTVAPANATNKTIVWTVKDAGTTGATITGNTLNATATGTATVTATIANGATATTPFTKDFNITVNAGFVAVTDITGVPATATTGTPLTLTGTVTPANATNQTIVWTVKNPGTTGATISGNTFNATTAGTATVTATIAGGATATTPYAKEFNITVNAATILVTGITITPATDISMEVGTTQQLTATVTPANATNKNVTWGVSVGGAYASVNSNGLVTGISPGTAFIRATAADGSGKIVEKIVTIIPNGSATYPYNVNSPALLQKVGSGTDGWTGSKHYFQTADIEMAGIAHTNPRTITTGTYDGNRYIISNLTCNTASAGLFSEVQSGGTVANVRLDKVSITGSAEAGGIAALVKGGGTILNCYVLSGSVTCTRSNNNLTDSGKAGGIAGTVENGGAVHHCYTDCTVSGYWNVGGIAGQSLGVIESCFAKGSVTGNSSMGRHTGGVAGCIYGRVSYCYATGDVSGSMLVGGIAGYCSGTVEYCYATGNVTAKDIYAGGIAGCIQTGSGNIRNCVALSKNVKSDVNETDQVGRVAGYNSGGTLSRNYARSDMVATRGGASISLNKGLNTVDGADVAQADYSGTNAGTWWSTTAQFPATTTIWSFASNRLPWLQVFTGVTQNPTVQN